MWIAAHVRVRHVPRVMRVLLLEWSHTDGPTTKASRLETHARHHRNCTRQHKAASVGVEMLLTCKQCSGRGFVLQELPAQLSRIQQ